ncbi:MAG: 16S rRNA (cytosine(1402)-N(4))-methyltransferase RsmH [Candidatus Dependentiae bacterium]|nr:16S rRNA (cytosine(1402)-N(4))-methyltransferase RsmH [Candidatus Dependentiae bacterium]
MTHNDNDDIEIIEPKRFHKPVLVQEVLTYLDLKPGKVYLDVTFGTGGHTRAILEREPGCRVIAMDWDQEILDTYGVPMVEEFGDRLRLIWGNFALLYKILKQSNIKSVDGILADFGTSQIQLMDRPGFSMFKDTPLDMRMSPAHQQITAYQVINKSSDTKLREIFWQLGEESQAKQITQAIMDARKKGWISTTKQLVEIIERVVPRQKKSRTHPATKVFQALRLYVNRELNNITAFMPMALPALSKGGHLVCISFHSLEDRLVKTFFREQEEKGAVKVLTHRVVSGTPEEIQENPSARSAKLRAVEKI